MAINSYTHRWVAELESNFMAMSLNCIEKRNLPAVSAISWYDVGQKTNNNNLSAQVWNIRLRGQNQPDIFSNPAPWTALNNVEKDILNAFYSFTADKDLRWSFILHQSN